MTTKNNINKYYENHNGIIYVTDVHNEYIYNYVQCEINEDGEIITTNNDGYITPQELKHYNEF